MEGSLILIALLYRPAVELFTTVGWCSKDLDSRHPVSFPTMLQFLIQFLKTLFVFQIVIFRLGLRYSLTSTAAFDAKHNTFFILMFTSTSTRGLSYRIVELFFFASFWKHEYEHERQEVSVKLYDGQVKRLERTTTCGKRTRGKRNRLDTAEMTDPKLDFWKSQLDNICTTDQKN